MSLLHHQPFPGNRKHLAEETLDPERKSEGKGEERKGLASSFVMMTQVAVVLCVGRCAGWGDNGVCVPVPVRVRECMRVCVQG